VNNLRFIQGYVTKHPWELFIFVHCEEGELGQSIEVVRNNVERQIRKEGLVLHLKHKGIRTLALNCVAISDAVQVDQNSVRIVCVDDLS
jgi:hypothetical protein